MINVVIEQQDGSPTTAEDATRWRDVLDLSFIVAADPEQAWTDVWTRRGDRHTYTVVDADGTILLHLYGLRSDTQQQLIDAATAP
ncbi:MAG TPA: hypothetical protein PKA64_10355 [Myxococcota bacterium]|nr:hypothetical protein [Myxococcota bacterium]